MDRLDIVRFEITATLVGFDVKIVCGESSWFVVRSLSIDLHVQYPTQKERDEICLERENIYLVQLLFYR